jgi:TolB-like protein/Tfp pilus assembly protein PilF
MRKLLGDEHMFTLGSVDIFQFEGFRCDRASGCLFWIDASNAAEPVMLGSRALALLALLVERQGQLVSKNEIMNAVWPGMAVEEGNLTVQISALRRILDRDWERGSCIQTISGRGYRFTAAVTRLTVEPRSHGAALPQSGASIRPRLSIAVLPFAILSDDAEQQYFADGITDDLTTDLSRIPGSFVIARTTASSYQGKPIEVKQIGRELGCRYVLEGSVRRIGERVQVNVQLIDAESGGHVWADRFETDHRNGAEAQRDITGRLTRTLALKLVEDVARRIEQETTTDPDAQDLVMLGEVWFRRWLRSTGRDPTQSLEGAQRYFERALAKNPRSIDARVGIAKIFINNLMFGWSTSNQEDSARAEQLLLEAIEIDPNQSEVYRYFGLQLRLQNRLGESRAALETAIEIDPNNASSRLQLGWSLLFLGQPEAGLAEGEEAVRRRPHDPEMRGVYQQLAWCLLLLNRVQPAIDMLTNALAGRPRQWVNHFALAAALGLKGDLDGARAALARSLAIKPDVDSLARFRICRPWGNAQHWTLFEKTVAAGLRRADFPDE